MSEKKAFKLQEFVAHSKNVRCLHIGRKCGQVLATGGDDCKVNVWRIVQPSCIYSLSGHTSPVECVSFDPLERSIVAGSAQGSLRLWDLETRKTISSLAGHRANVLSVDVHPVSSYLASGSADTNMKVWDIRLKSCVQTYKGHEANIMSVRFSPDGRLAASGDLSGTIKVWDLVNGKQFAEFHQGGAITSLQYHNKELMLLSGSRDRTVGIWDLESKCETERTPVEATGIRGLSLTNDDNVIVAAANDNMRVWQLRPLESCDYIEMPRSEIADMALTESDQLVGCSFKEAFVAVWVVNLPNVKPFSNRWQRIEPSGVGNPESPILPPKTAESDSGAVLEAESRLIPVDSETLSVGELKGKGVAEGLSASGKHVSVAAGPENPLTASVFKAQAGEVSMAQPIPVVGNRAPKVERTSGASDFGVDLPGPQFPVHDGARDAIAPPLASNVVEIPGRLRWHASDTRPGLPRPEKRGPSPVSRPVVKRNVFDPFQPRRELAQKPLARGPSVGASADEVLDSLMREHRDIRALLLSRLDIVRMAAASWKEKDVTGILNAVSISEDQEAFADILRVTKWAHADLKLDHANQLLPLTMQLLSSGKAAHAAPALKTLTFLANAFASLVRSTRAAGSAFGGADIAREERLKKCNTFFEFMGRVRQRAAAVAQEHPSETEAVERLIAAIDKMGG